MQFKWYESRSLLRCIPSFRFQFICVELISPLFLQQCQSAALDELFGKPGVCFPRYQTAQILFHSLAQQTDHPQDKNILGKCKFCSFWKIENLSFIGLIVKFIHSNLILQIKKRSRSVCLCCKSKATTFTQKPMTFSRKSNVSWCLIRRMR